MKREDGFYWCKYQDEWIVAECYELQDEFRWIVGGRLLEDSDFDEIDENRIIRDLEMTNEWQLCPKCDGSGYRLPFPGGFEAMEAKTTGKTTIECDLCNGKKIISKVNGLPPE